MSERITDGRVYRIQHTAYTDSFLMRVIIIPLAGILEALSPGKIQGHCGSATSHDLKDEMLVVAHFGLYQFLSHLEDFRWLHG